MKADELRKTAHLFRRAANMFRLDALPETWPSWMTKDKRASMADNFDKYAADVDRHCSQINP